MKRTEKGNDLARFGNALRNFLDLEPIYQVGREGMRPASQPCEAERFYMQLHSLPQASARKRTHS